MIIGKTNIKQDNYDCLILCARDIKHIQIPNFIKHICSSSFDRCMQLDEICIPSDLKLETIEKHAFYYSTIKLITIPSSVTSIGEDAFAGCVRLEKIIIPSDSKLKAIEKNAFCSSGIKSISIPSSVTSIGKSAFDNFEILQIVEINNREMISIVDKLTSLYGQNAKILILMHYLYYDEFKDEKLRLESLKVGSIENEFDDEEECNENSGISCYQIEKFSDLIYDKFYTFDDKKI